jgi:DNA-binding LytR/AlgR family response regulator
MKHQIRNAFLKSFPQNFIFKHPRYGALLIALFTFLFTMLYQPLGSHAGRFFGFGATMAAYSLISAAVVFGMLKFLKRAKFFSKNHEWNLFKELSAIFIVLLGMGIVIYFAAFLLEEPAERWNLATLLDSIQKSFLIGIIPFLFFSVLNYRSRNISNRSIHGDSSPNIAAEELIQINSQLKKETLSFYPSQFLFAVSEGNYVNFFIQTDGKIQKKVIRNSINDVEQQLVEIPYLFRTHRAFIANLKKIKTKKGNSLGYRLRLWGIEEEIPVSRNKSKEFNKLYKQLA